MYARVCKHVTYIWDWNWHWHWQPHTYNHSETTSISLLSNLPEYEPVLTITDLNLCRSWSIPARSITSRR